MTFFDIAKPMAERGEPQIRVRPKSKVAMDDNWPTLATTDLGVLKQWSYEVPDANAASVAKAQLGGVWFWEIDKPEVLQRMESETGKKLSGFFRVRSSPGRGHYHFLQSQKSMAMGNIAQGSVKGADWSARVHDQYVISPGSLHVNTGKPYEIVSNSPLQPAPDWLVEWLSLQKIEPKSDHYSINSTEKIPYGAHDTALTSIAGSLRHIGLEQDSIYNAIVEVCEKRCIGYGSDYLQMCSKIAASVCRYAPGKDTPILVNGKDPRLEVVEEHIEEPEFIPEFVVPPYPKFPHWVMRDTSIYNGFVRPICEKNSRYEEFLFMPAVLLFLNYLGTKVRIQNKDIIPSLYLGLIGKKGRVIKSSSVQDAINYFRYAGVVDHADSNTRNAEGRTLVFTAGSPEGLGIELQRTSCHNSVLFYDELSILTNKAGIESSTLVPALLTLYESGKFSNSIKSKKESYSLAPNSYCNSLIFCCTDKNFKTLWGKMSGVTSGLNDRFCFVMQPETLKDVTPPISVATQDGALETRKLIDRAVMQGVYRIVDSSPLAAVMNGDNKFENREEIRAEKFALYFCIDSGKTEIDEEDIEKGLALVEYERAVKKKLRPSESVTREAQVQNDLVDFLLSQKDGKATYREILRAIHPERLGTSLWSQSFQGLVKAGQIMVQGKGTKADPKLVTLLHAPEESDD